MPRIQGLKVQKPSFLNWLYNPCYQESFDQLFEDRCARALKLINASNKNINLGAFTFIIPNEAAKALRALIAMKGIDSTIEAISEAEDFTNYEKKILTTSILRLARGTSKFSAAA